MSTSAGSLDANIVLRLLLNDVPEQHDAAVRLLSSSTNPFSVADTAIVETIFVLERNYKVNRSAICDSVSDFLSLSSIQANTSLFKLALPLFKAHPSLSFEDCCLSSYAELQNAIPLWTFDKKHAKQVDVAKLVGQS